MRFWQHLEEEALDHLRRLIGIAAFIVATLAVQWLVDMVPNLSAAETLPAKYVVAIAELSGVAGFVLSEVCSTIQFIRKCCAH